MSNETALLIDKEIKRLVEDGLARAREVIKEHLDQLHAIAGALLEHETITGDEIKRIVAGEEIRRDDQGTKAPVVVKAGTSIPKTRRPSGPFGSPSPLGA
jgi:cell division protease FtsH